MRRVLLAVTANLDSKGSVHSATFQRAVEIAVDWLSAEQQIEVALTWIDDQASPAGGLRAARAIVRSPVEAVIGHFASGAALAAAPLYEQAGLPLFLPAATAERLTGSTGVYRLCDSDSDYVIWFVDWIARRSYRRVFIDTDDSIHGVSIRQRLLQSLPANRHTNHMDTADALVFSGMFEHILSCARAQIRQGDRRPLLLTDDAQSDRLVEGLGASTDNIRVFGFRVTPRTPAARIMADVYRKRWGQPPGIYFFETVAAVQIAANWLHHGVWRRPIDTVLGPIAFDERGESRPRRFICFRPHEGRLIETDHQESLCE